MGTSIGTEKLGEAYNNLVDILSDFSDLNDEIRQFVGENINATRKSAIVSPSLGKRLKNEWIKNTEYMGNFESAVEQWLQSIQLTIYESESTWDDVSQIYAEKANTEFSNKEAVTTPKVEPLEAADLTKTPYNISSLSNYNRRKLKTIALASGIDESSLTNMTKADLIKTITTIHALKAAGVEDISGIAEGNLSSLTYGTNQNIEQIITAELNGYKGADLRQIAIELKVPGSTLIKDNDTLIEQIVETIMK